ncbi:hypothetical protein JW911_05135 [Candidatus Peregrinibacteria bacterium]|nr:hypothetical protein [Candidatus Peregrinibacteria bacterium]
MEEFKQPELEPEQPEQIETHQERKTEDPRVRTFNTPQGYIRGKIVNGREGGPYIIETPDGHRMKVENISQYSRY